MFGTPFGAFPGAGFGQQMGDRAVHPGAMDPFRNPLEQFLMPSADEEMYHFRGQPETVGVLPGARVGLRVGDRAVRPGGMAHSHNPLAQFLLRAAAEQNDQSSSQPAAADTALRELPAIKVTSYDIEQNDSPDCVICLEPLVLGEEANRIPCGHLFHERCIKGWLGTSNQCPVCRYELPTDDVRYEQERRSHSGSRQPRLRRADLTAKSIRELCHLARHLGVRIDGCIEKEELVQRLAASGTIELICDDATRDRPSAPASLPNACKLSSARLADMSINEIRYQMVQMGVDVAGCQQKRDLIQRLVDAGRVVASSHDASQLTAPSECRSPRGVQDQSEIGGAVAESAVSDDVDDGAIVVYRHEPAVHAIQNCMDMSSSTTREDVEMEL